MLALNIDTNSATPIFQQISHEIERLILIGELGPGDFIPSVREFATTHTINPNTVAKAYALLQSKGLVTAVRGTGLQVAAQASRDLSKRRQSLLHEKVRILMDEAFALGFSKTEVIRAINEMGSSARRLP